MSIFEYDEELHRRTLLEEGIEIGEKRGICATIDILREMNLPQEEIVQKIVKQYKISPEQAQQYWD